MNVWDNLDLPEEETTQLPAALVVRRDNQATLEQELLDSGFEYADLRSTLLAKIASLPQEQGNLRVQFLHEVNPNSSPEVYYERLAFLVVRECVRVWGEQNRRNLRVRQNQNYPDIGIYEERDILVLGVEVKTYNLCCKEQKPTARFKVSRDGCGAGDFIVLIPYVYQWGWEESGPPSLFDPFTWPALDFARRRDREWNAKDGRKLDVVNGVVPGEFGVRERVNVHDRNDRGNNAGRLGRIDLPDLHTHLRGLMDRHHSPDGKTRFQLWKFVELMK